jgi:hypothetical protein
VTLLLRVPHTAGCPGREHPLPGTRSVNSAAPLMIVTDEPRPNLVDLLCVPQWVYGNHQKHLVAVHNTSDGVYNLPAAQVSIEAFHEL